MNNFTPSNPYTTKVPVGTLNRVQLSLPQNVQIQWPNRSGNNLPNNTQTQGFWSRLFA